MLRSTVPLLDLSFFSNLTHVKFGILSSKIKNENDMSPEFLGDEGRTYASGLGVFPSPFSVAQLLCSI